MKKLELQGLGVEDKDKGIIFTFDPEPEFRVEFEEAKMNQDKNQKLSQKAI